MDRYLGTRDRFDQSLREKDIVEAVRHSVVCACRGGYGSLQLLPVLENAKVRRPPPLLGLSDITSLHSYWMKCDAFSCYGVLPEHLESSRSGETVVSFFNGDPYTRTGHEDAMVRVLRAGGAEGLCYGGCLTVLASLCGTPWQPNLEGAIFFLEDVDEKPWQWDNALTQLYFSGALRGVRALVGGSAPFQEATSYGGPSVDEILVTWSERLGVPCLSRLPFGHLDDPIAIPNGWHCRLSSSRQGRWKIEFNVF